MKVAPMVGSGVAALLLMGMALGADGPIKLPEELTASIELEGGRISGTRHLQVSIRIDSLTPRETARQLAGLTRNGGQGTLVSALKGTSNGRIILGVIEYPLNLITIIPLEGKRRYVAVTARPFDVTEVNTGQPSLEYPFGVISFDLDDRGSGEGTLFLAASIAVSDEGTIVVESYSETPGRIVEVRRK
jgi:hypothetical protein